MYLSKTWQVLFLLWYVYTNYSYKKEIYNVESIEFEVERADKNDTDTVHHKISYHDYIKSYSFRGIRYAYGKGKNITSPSKLQECISTVKDTLKIIKDTYKAYTMRKKKTGDERW